MRCAVDLVPIRVGSGGTGSGIWSYARELLLRMDAVVPDGMELICFVNRAQVAYLLPFKRIRLVVFPECGSVLYRLLWVHIVLPLVCLFHRVGVLHKVATETPFLCFARRVTTVHDFYYEFLSESRPPSEIRLYERMERFYFEAVTRACFKKSRSIIAVSQSTCREAKQRYPIAAGRVTTIYHGSPPIEIQERYVDCGGFTILCVAKFMEHKGQHHLIAAFEHMMGPLSETGEEIRLVLRGFHNDSDYMERIERQVNNSPFCESIDLLGYDSEATVNEIYRNVDLVVLLSAYEGFGLPVLEAQSRGIPVVVSSLPVLKEVGGAGVCVAESEDASVVAQCMLRFVEEPEYYAQMSRQSVENAKRFTWGKAARQTLEVYQACFDGR